MNVSSAAALGYYLTGGSSSSGGEERQHGVSKAKHTMHSMYTNTAFEVCCYH